MVSDTVNTILDAEKKADENLKQAKKEAERIVADAKSKAERMKEEAKANAEQQAAALRLDYRATLKDIENKSEKEFRESVSEIKLKAGKKLDEAADLVIRKLIS